jgi:hypothetical protein
MTDSPRAVVAAADAARVRHVRRERLRVAGGPPRLRDQGGQHPNPYLSPRALHYERYGLCTQWQARPRKRALV